MRGYLIYAMVVVWAVGTHAAGWPQFLGPDRNGIAPEAKLARAWPEGGPPVLWSFPLGAGFGGAAVDEGRVYILDRVKNKEDILLCLDLNTGKELWRFSYEAPGTLNFEGPRSTPTVDKKYVFVIGPMGQVHCIDKNTHQAIWRKDLVSDFGTVAPTWAFAQSPLLYKDMVVLAPQSAKAGLVALRKETGEVAWTAEAMGKPGYCSPMLVKVADTEQVVMLTTLGDEKSSAPDSQQHPVQLTGTDPATGRILWTFSDWKCKYPIPSPTAVGDGRFFLTGGYGAGCAMVKVTKEDGRFKAARLFGNMNCGSQIQNAIVYGDHLYANSNNTNSGLVCLGLDGNVKWSTGQKPGFELGNLILADGLIFAMDGNKGILRLVEARPDGYKEVGQAKIVEGKGGLVWGPMALADGKLIVRDQTQVKCVNVSAP